MREIQTATGCTLWDICPVPKWGSSAGEQSMNICRISATVSLSGLERLLLCKRFIPIWLVCESSSRFGLFAFDKITEDTKNQVTIQCMAEEYTESHDQVFTNERFVKQIFSQLWNQRTIDHRVEFKLCWSVVQIYLETSTRRCWTVQGKRRRKWRHLFKRQIRRYVWRCPRRSA